VSARVPLALVAMAVWAGAAAEQPIVVKFSHVVAVDTPKGQAAQFFRERAEVLTGGRVRWNLDRIGKELIREIYAATQFRPDGF